MHGNQSQDVDARGSSGALSGSGLETNDEPNTSIGHRASAPHFTTNIYVNIDATADITDQLDCKAPPSTDRGTSIKLDNIEKPYVRHMHHPYPAADLHTDSVLEVGSYQNFCCQCQRGFW